MVRLNVIALIIFLFVCGSCTKNTTPTETVINSTSDSTIEIQSRPIPYEYNSFDNRKVDKDLNHDGLRDSIRHNYERNGEEEKLSIFFGCENGDYNLVKEFVYGSEWEIEPYIYGDTLSIAGRGYSYSFKYTENNLYLIGYEYHANDMSANYELDFTNKKIIYKIDQLECAKKGETFVRSIDMPSDKVLKHYSIDDFFNGETCATYEYVHYDDLFHQAKIDSFTRIINSEFLESSTNFIDD